MSLLRNVATVGSATLASRVLGFVRDTMIAAALGSGPVAEAFLVAFRLPNLFRRLFAEGAFAAAFVPLYVEVRDGAGAGAARHFAGEALIGLIVIVTAVSVPAMIWAPALVGLLAPGFGERPETFELAVALTRLCFPYLGAISCVALLSGVLGAHRRFLVPAAAPVLLNTVLIATLGGLLATKTPAGPFSGRMLAAAVTVAGLAQLALLIATVRALRLTPRPGIGFGPRLVTLVRRALPGLIAGGFGELNVVVGTMIASVEVGAVSWLYYADRLYQLPLGVIGIAIGQVLLPEIAIVLASATPERVDAVQNRALELALALAVPAAVALVVLAHPIVTVLFVRGAFGASDAEAAARALALFALGLPGVVLTKVMQPGFFARGDTRTPMLIGIAAVAINVGLALALWPLVGWIAVPAATAVAGSVNGGLHVAVLARRGHWRSDRRFRRRLPRLVAAAAVMGLTIALAGPLAAAMRADGGPATPGIGGLALLVGLGLAVYGGLVVALGVIDRTAFAGSTRGRASGEPLPDGDPACRRPRDRA